MHSTVSHASQAHTAHGIASSDWQFPPPVESIAPQSHRQAKEYEVPQLLPNNHRGGRATQPWDLDDSNSDFGEFLDLTAEEELDVWITEPIDIPRPSTRSSEVGTGRRSLPRVLRNLPVSAPLISLESFTHNKVKVNPKANVALLDGDFMRIVDVLQDTITLKVTLRGWIFRRTRDMNGHLEKKMNELCWILHIDEDDGRPHKIQGMESRSINDVVRRRRIRLTNRPFPELSYREDVTGQSNEAISNERELVCRTKYTCYYENAKARDLYCFCEKAYERLRANECDQSFGVQNDGCAADDGLLRDRWRGDTVQGGACKGWTYGEKEFSKLELNDHHGPQHSGLHHHLGRATSSMEQGAVGKLVTESDLQTSDTSAESAPVAIDPPPKFESGVRRHSGVSNAKSNTLGSSIIDLTGPGLINLNQGLTLRSSLSERSPEIIDITAGIDLSSRAGTMHQEYVGRVTTTFHPRATKRSERDTSHVSDRKSKALKLSPKPSTAYPTPIITTPGSSFHATKKTEPGTTVRMPRQPTGQRYTFGDCFSGAGGTSRGATMAGLRVQWGFDFNLPACRSYALNFHGATIYNLWADKFAFLSEKSHNLKVDVVHMSPPCQPYSPAHTTKGKYDEQNEASLFAVTQLLLRTNPRIVTLEETAGLPTRHADFFNPLIHMFNARSFSVRWRTVNLADFGLPQRRMRLLLIASWYVFTSA